MSEKPSLSDNIATAFIKVCSQVENVKRDTNGQIGNTKYKYATLEAVLEMLQPLLKQQGLALAQYVENDSLIAKLYHIGGGEIAFGSYNLGALDKHQARGSAITYGRRYQLCAIFGITQEDDDGKAASEKYSGPTENPIRNEFPTSVAMKKQYQEVLDAIGRATQLDHVDWVKGQIAKFAKVDTQLSDSLQDALDERLEALNG